MRNFNSTLKKKRKQNQHQYHRQVTMYVSLLLFYDWLSLEFVWTYHISTRDNQKKIKSYCHVNMFRILINEQRFLKTISQWEFDNGLFTNLWTTYCRLRLFSNFVQTVKWYLTSIDKRSILTWKLLSYQANILIVIWTSRELTPFKISHIFSYGYKKESRRKIYRQ